MNVAGVTVSEFGTLGAQAPPLSCKKLQSRKNHCSLPRGSNVVPFLLWLSFFLRMIIYFPKKNYVGALG